MANHPPHAIDELSHPVRIYKFIWFLVLTGTFALAALSHAQTVLVNGAQTNQVIEGFGVNLNYSGWTNNDLKPVIDALVDKANFNMFRLVFDNTDWEATNDNSDSTVMNWDYYNTIYSSPRFQQLWGVMGYLNQKGITNGLILSFQGLLPTWMGGGHLNVGSEDEWAEMIASLLYYARNTQNLKFTVINPVNEPDVQPQGFALSGGTSQYVTMLHSLSVKLDALGMSDIRFVGPDLAYTDTNFLATIMTDPVVMAKMPHFGIHSYSAGGGGSTGVYNFIRRSPYPDRTFWMAEFNLWCGACEEGQYGVYDWNAGERTAQFLLSHLANGASAGMVWEGYDSVYNIYYGPRWSMWGLFGVNDTNAVSKTYTPRKNFYTLSQISKFIQPGAYSIGITNNQPPFQQLLAFWQPATAQFTLTGCNAAYVPAQIAVNLSSLPTVQSIELYYTDSTSNLVHLPTIPVTNGNFFTTTIPPLCIFTFVANAAMAATITSPLTGAQFSKPTAIPINASVSAAVGSVTRVDYYCGTTNIGTSTNSPFGIVWNNPAPGNYVLTAQGINSLGNTVTSPPVNITVIGPMAQIALSPPSTTLSPFTKLQFSAAAQDALGTPLNPQPPLAWSARGGTVDSNGLFTAGGIAGTYFGVNVSNSSVSASASVNILPNLALGGTGYIWYSLTNSTQNSPGAVAPGINDGNILTSVSLLASGPSEPAQAWEAAGVVWNSAQTINRVTYINGAFDQNQNGVFDANFGLQFSPDGTTWTNAGPEWTVSPAYGYNSAATGNMSFVFSGGQVVTRGIRVIGLVRTSETSQNSWVASATEVQAFMLTAPCLLQANLMVNGTVVSWDCSLTNYVLQSTTNPAVPSSWSAVTNIPQQFGHRQQVTASPGGRAQLFRLRQLQ